MDFFLQFLRGARLRLKALFRLRAMEEELRDELSHHIQLETEQNIRAGMSPGEARRKALVDFGGVDRFREETRSVWSFRLLREAGGDFRFATRRLRKEAASTLAILLCLGLGFGATAGVFSFFFGIVLRPLPFPGAGDLAILFETAPGFSRASPSFEDFQGWRENATAFHGLGAYSRLSRTVTGPEGPEILAGTGVSHDLFRVLGVDPELGRGFGPEDDGPGAAPSVMISYRLWQERYGGSPAILGRTMTLDGSPHSVVGVMPEGFAFPEEARFWTPLRTSASPNPGSLSAVLGRLAPGVSIEGARAEMDRVAAIMREAYPQANAQREIAVRSLEEDFLWGLKAPVTLFLLVAVFVLSLAIANVANLLLAQGTVRNREMLVRTAMGAGRARILRQLLTESLLLAFGGALLGLVLGIAGRNLFLSFLPEDFPYFLRFDMDAPVLVSLSLFTLGVAVLFGLAPALHTTRVDLFGVLRGGGESRGGAGGGDGKGGRGERWLRTSLVTLQVALALVVLAGTGTATRSLSTLRGVDPGLDPENLLTMEIALSRGFREDPDRQRLAFQEIRDRVADLPGVVRASFISHLPVVGAANGTSLYVEGTEAPPEGQEPWVITKQAQPDYFETMGIPILQGRDFDPADGSPGSPPVVVVNQRFALRYWPPGQALGKRIKYGRPDSPFSWMEVVGVVGDVRHFGQESPVELGIYEPMNQQPYWRETLVIRAHGDPGALVRPVVARVQNVDPDAPVYAIREMDEVLFRSTWRPVVLARLLWVFSGLALTLALLGVYGVVAFSVARRRREFGIRMALGAGGATVQGEALGGILSPVGLGLGLGLFLSWVGIRLTASLLYGVQYLDPGVGVFVAVILALLAGLATYIPSRQASRLDPAEVLRE